MSDPKIRPLASNQFAVDHGTNTFYVKQDNGVNYVREYGGAWNILQPNKPIQLGNSFFMNNGFNPPKSPW